MRQAARSLSGASSSACARARADYLSSDPVLDEPLSALDPFLRLRMRTELKKAAARAGISFIHVTHGQDEAMALVTSWF